ncbi:unnamed protein product [Darwinula stevensoni]|uniref:Phospholipid scramblase n=1 Tax=Darwinula stevensoni TaxID=69355 RepID=A0A7R9FPY1_9CRUS|nr:unnamed protein product [Darwinula stevensoni]CAG0898295.1 unnamed protein product [Darwinula stevensoni]
MSGVPAAGWNVHNVGIEMTTGGPHCPPGLEYLTTIDQLLVHQKVEILEAITTFETANKYSIKNSMGQKIYSASEDTDCCTRNILGPYRCFELQVLDHQGREVIHLSRPLNCDSCWFPCCLQRLDVYSPPGTLIGVVKQEWSILSPKFTIQDAAGNAILLIEGPICTWSICGDVEFQILTLRGDNIGRISKQWSGLLKEGFTDADNFGVTFPMDLDVKMKATLLAATFLLDFMFFEKKGRKERDTPGMF